MISASLTCPQTAALATFAVDIFRFQSAPRGPSAKVRLLALPARSRADRKGPFRVDLNRSPNHRATTAICAIRTAGIGRVEMWRGDVRLSMSVSAPFVWRCLSGSAVAPFPHPAHRTGRADFPHPALGQDLTPSFACDAIGSF